MIYIFWFLGLLGAILIALLFIKIKVRLVYNEDEAFVQLKYSFFSYQIDLKEKVDALADNLEQKAKETLDNMQEDDPLKNVDFKREKQVLTLKPTDKEVLAKHKVSSEELKAKSLQNKGQAQRFEQSKKIEKTSIQQKKDANHKCDATVEKKSWFEKWNVLKFNRAQKRIDKQASKKRDHINKRIDKIQFKEKREKLFLTIKQYKIYLEVGLRILRRFVSRIHIHQLFSYLNFNVEDPMLNGCLLGMAWGVNANVYRFIQTHVKKVNKLDFDVKTQFSGNNIFIKFECIISVRLVDIIMVFLLSLRDLLIIRKTYKLKEDMI
ncbi:MAG TPA: hypothetical protein DCY20_02095 [Firmicutes bacterium]|nr:hypothetical protein [Bacillota bacterium]